MAKFGAMAMMVKESFGEVGAYTTLAKVNKIGYNAVEISQVPMTPENVVEMDRARNDLGMEIAALSASLEKTPGTSADSLTDDFDKIVADCKLLDCSMLRIGMLPLDAMESLEKVLEFCRKSNEMADRLADQSIGLYYHNHHIEFTRYNGKYLLDVIRESAPLIRFELDVHWIHRGGRDPVTVLKEYAGLVDLVHLKDYRIGHMSPDAFQSLAKGNAAAFMNAFYNVVQFAEVGEGNLDFKAIIDQALKSGAKYMLVEQDEQYGRDPFDCLATSRQNLAALGYEHLF